MRCGGHVIDYMDRLSHLIRRLESLLVLNYCSSNVSRLGVPRRFGTDLRPVAGRPGNGNGNRKPTAAAKPVEGNQLLQRDAGHGCAFGD